MSYQAALTDELELPKSQEDERIGRFTFLGTGASSGVPVVGCDCSVCRSSSLHNQRLRPSGLISVLGKQLLIDAGPDFRYQALRAGIQHIDGVLFTHTHYDHTGGLDELRIFYFRQKKPLPCLLSQESYKDITIRFYYMFREHMHGSNFTARLDWNVLERDRGTVLFQDVPIRYVSYSQGGMGVNGFRFGDFAYISDIYEYPESIFEDLEGIKTLVVGALRHSESFVHFTVEQAVNFSNRVGAEKVWLTHISHDLDHDETNRQLPRHIRMGYDGLEIAFKI